MAGFQGLLRLKPNASELWEGLGAAYHALGRITAALKVGCNCLSIRCAGCARFLYEQAYSLQPEDIVIF